jgi:hypothetical protein
MKSVTVIPPTHPINSPTLDAREGCVIPSQDPKKFTSLRTSVPYPQPLVMTNVGAPLNAINTISLSLNRANGIDPNTWDVEHVIRSIFSLATNPVLLEGSLNLRDHSRVASPTPILPGGRSDEMQVLQVVEARDDLNKADRVVNKVAKREREVGDKLALTSDDLLGHLDKLKRGGGLEEEAVVFETEPSLRTGLHGAEDFLEVVISSDVANLLADMEEWWSAGSWLESAAVIIAHVEVIPLPDDSSSVPIVLHSHLPDLDAKFGW